MIDEMKKAVVAAFSKHAQPIVKPHCVLCKATIEIGLDINKLSAHASICSAHALVQAVFIH